MPYTTNARNGMLDGLFGIGSSSGTWASLHTADPTITVAAALGSEASGGVPVYARQQVNFAATSNGNKGILANIVFNVPAGIYTHYSLWKVSSGGIQADFIGSAALDSPKVVVFQDTITLTSINVRD